MIGAFSQRRQEGEGHKDTGGGVVLNGRRATSENNVVGDEARVRNGGGESNSEC